MSVARALAEMVAKGAQITADGERLRYRAAKGVLTEGDLRVLKERKGEVLKFLGGRRAVRLSSVQERLWFLSRLDESGVGYSFSFTHRIRGALDPARLAAALDTAVREHPGLCAVFVEVEGTPLQLLGGDVQVDTLRLDRSGASFEEAARSLREALAEPFDLARGPLIRSVLLALSPEDHLWGMALHHLVADGRTFGILVREVSRILAGGAPPATAPLDYADFVEWERTRADSPERAANHAYWVDHLAGIPDLDLPLDHPRPPVRTHRGGLVQVPFTAALLGRLEAFARREEATRFAVLLAVSFVLLHRSTGQDDLAVGSPHANRADAGFEDTAGCFVSTLVLRADLSGKPTFRELARRVARVCMEAWDHQDASYERLVSRLSPVRDMSRNALFQVFFALQNIFEPLVVPGAQAEMVHLDPGVVQFDLELHFFIGAAGSPAGILLYNRDLFEEVSVQRMAARWTRLAEALLADPDRPITEAGMLSGVEREQALTALCAPATDYPRSARLEALFAAQARRTPGRTAAVCRGEATTYDALHRRATALSRRLVTLGGSAGATVGILLERSVDMLASLLAIPGAGAVFLPLDPALPPERLAFMLEDGKVRVVITQQSLRARLPAGVAQLLVDVEDGAAAATAVKAFTAVAAAGAGEADAADAESTAYLLYTSGSTGKPKGVHVSHRSLINLLHAMGRAPGLTADDVLCAVTSLSFDIALLELLLPVVTGATVVIASRDEASDPVTLGALLASCGATVMQATPSSWGMLLDAGWAGRPGLRALVGGEALSRALADRLLDTCAEVWNLYGPTETTLWSTRWRVTRDVPISLGEPIENTRLYILDDALAPTPPGLAGELWIAGDGVAQGYLNRSAETARRFQDLGAVVGHPERAYRTGDLVRVLPGGSLVFLGRTDQQLKVRGYRIEPEEIEHALRVHPGVREVVATQSPSGALVAHLVAQSSATSGEEVSERALHDHAARVLPTYMVPQRFVVHERLPRTANGKIDRRALSSIPLSSPLSSPGEVATREPPADAIEASVAALFAEVLGIADIGSSDDFFALGGHSLIAARVLYGIQQRHSVNVGLHELFKHPTVAGLAARVRDAVMRRAEEDLAIGDALTRLESMSEEEAARLFAQLVAQ
ncbi:non-ribosomal peptide synthetase [Chondromyces apiculatus]|uniref:Long-chain-fatty-acid--CoA ligase n=1 Tax=Chondromyces apiculatus DSM 436 TaxID=1192034 RepID=A0A017SUW9_9BACT|nr:non-ribosomal peptide synthetase [Chondromyces apiculatus]EYF00532.1 Long-chain-fatty-acid--CoA ligase [Chondromyces apiculatus DSM 436]